MITARQTDEEMARRFFICHVFSQSRQEYEEMCRIIRIAISIFIFIKRKHRPGEKRGFLLTGSVYQPENIAFFS